MVIRSATVNGECIGVRQQILDEAGKLFLHYGFKKTTVDDIARSAGISKGAVYLHFDSKEMIFHELVRQVREHVVGILNGIAGSAATPDDKIRRMHVDSLLFVWDHHHQAPHAPEVWGETIAMFSRDHEEFLSGCQGLVAGVVAEGQSQGMFRRDLEPERTAWVLSMSVQGFAPPYLRVSERRQLEEGIADTVNLILDGMRCQNEPDAGLERDVCEQVVS